MGYLLTRPNIALLTAAVDPRTGHLSFVSDDVRDDVWTALENFLLAEQHAPVVPLDDGMPPPPPVDIAQALANVRRVFEATAPDDPLDIRKDPNLQPLVWWGKLFAKGGYDALKPLIEILLATPRTSAASERVFSGASLLSRLVD